MTLADLIARARLITDDQVAPYAVSDAEFTTFANRAVREACDRGGALYGTVTLPILAGQSLYALDHEILSIDFAALPGRKLCKLVPTDLDWLQIYSPMGGVPSVFSQREHTIELYPTPDAGTTLTLKVYRYSEPLGVSADEPEIDQHHHDYLPH